VLQTNDEDDVNAFDNFNIDPDFSFGGIFKYVFDSFKDKFSYFTSFSFCKKRNKN